MLSRHLQVVVRLFAYRLFFYRLVAYDCGHVCLAVDCCFLHFLVLAAAHFILLASSLSQSFACVHLVLLATVRAVVLVELVDHLLLRLFGVLLGCLLTAIGIYCALRSDCPKLLDNHLFVVVYYARDCFFNVLARRLGRLDVRLHPLHLGIWLCGHFAVCAQLRGKQLVIRHAVHSVAVMGLVHVVIILPLL